MLTGDSPLRRVLTGDSPLSNNVTGDSPLSNNVTGDSPLRGVLTGDSPLSNKVTGGWLVRTKLTDGACAILLLRMCKSSNVYPKKLAGVYKKYNKVYHGLERRRDKAFVFTKLLIPRNIMESRRL